MLPAQRLLRDGGAGTRRELSPRPQELEKKNLDHYLPALRNTMGSVLGRSFFITRDMDRQFRGQVTDGLMIPILQILVRTGHTINGFRYVTLNDAGPAGRPSCRMASATSKHGNKGVEISYRTDADGSLHHLSLSLGQSGRQAPLR